MSSFHLVFLEDSLVLSFEVCFIVFPFWLPLGVCFYVIGRSARRWCTPSQTLPMTGHGQPVWSYQPSTACGFLCLPCLCEERTRLHPKAGFYQHRAWGMFSYSLSPPRDLPLPALILLGLKSKSLPDVVLIARAPAPPGEAQ